jgi:lipopolysaccharide transport system permease protein
MSQVDETSHTSILIEPEKGWISLNLRELWNYRELVGFLAWRDIAAQYKQAFFGITWALVQPVSQALIYTLVFGKVAKLTSSGLPYMLFTFCGIMAWGLFSKSLTSSTGSIVANTNLITKVYFPRLVIPLSSLGRGGVDFLISCAIFLIMMIAYGTFPSKTIVFFPFFLLLGLAITLGIGLIFSAISVKYRDLAHALPFMVQLWFWVTPVAYGLENIPEKLTWIFYLNPMTWIIQGFRWSLLGVGQMAWQKILVTALFSFAVLLAGLFYFKRMENEFADII